MPESTIQIHTDGACLGNPGPGGFGIIIDVDGEEQRFGGGEAQTTNNRMELTAALTAIKIVRNTVPGADKRDMILHTDSRYVTDAFSQDWIKGWKSRNWRNGKGEPIKNQDLWKEMIEEAKPLNIAFQWAKGHSGDPANEVCDEMAKEQAQRYINPNYAGDEQQAQLPRATAAPREEQPTGPSLGEEQARIRDQATQRATKPVRRNSTNTFTDWDRDPRQLSEITSTGTRTAVQRSWNSSRE